MCNSQAGGGRCLANMSIVASSGKKISGTATLFFSQLLMDKHTRTVMTDGKTALPDSLVVLQYSHALVPIRGEEYLIKIVTYKLDKLFKKTSKMRNIKK